LQELYNQINQLHDGQQPVTCPQCQHSFALEQAALGG
jgi:hypothetical protein